MRGAPHARILGGLSVGGPAFSIGGNSDLRKRYLVDSVPSRSFGISPAHQSRHVPKLSRVLLAIDHLGQRNALHQILYIVVMSVDPGNKKNWLPALSLSVDCLCRQQSIYHLSELKPPAQPDLCSHRP